MTHCSAIVAGLAFATGLLTQGSTEATGAAALQGTWVITSLNAQLMSEGAAELTLTFTGDKYHQTVGGEVNERGTITVDASQKPMTIDFVITEGDEAGKTQLGVVDVSGDAMRASLATPGAANRPADFSVKDGGLVLVAKRMKR